MPPIRRLAAAPLLLGALLEAVIQLDTIFETFRCNSAKGFRA